MAVPVTMYWALQRNDMHARWDQQERYAFEVWRHSDWAAGLLSGNIDHWNNETEQFTLNELSYADYGVYGLSVLDSAHANRLDRISSAVETLRTQDYVHNMTSAQRTELSNQLESLGHDMLFAYSNYWNYTSNGVGVGPAFWYSGPAPPDERLLQNAVSIACAFQRGGCP